MFVIMGATGKVGGATIAALRRARLPVRAVVRDTSGASAVAALAALGCDIAMADLRDPATLVPAMRGAHAVQVICPISPKGEDAAGDMRAVIASLGQALAAAAVPRVLAISDYGAELTAGTGVTLLFHALEAQLRALPSRLIILRSAEHMENWSRVAMVAAQTGILPSLHHPVTKRFPTVSAVDVGTIAADLLMSEEWGDGGDGSPPVVHVEGPERYTTLQVARTLGTILGKEITAHAVPAADWPMILRRGGLSESYAGLVIALYAAHNAGLIDARSGMDQIRYGETPLLAVLRRFMASA